MAFPQIGLRAVFEISGFQKNSNRYQRTMRDIDRITKQTAQSVSQAGQGLASSLDDLIRNSSLLGDAIQRLPLGDQLPLVTQWDQAFRDLGDGVQVSVEKFDQLIRSGFSFEDALQGAAQSADELGGSINILGRSFTTTAVAVTAITAALGASIRLVQQSISEYSELAEATRRLRAETGLLSKEASGWIQVAQASGVSAQTASRGMTQFLSKVADLRREQQTGEESTGDFAEALEFLQVSIADGEGNLKTTEQLLNDVNAAFQRLGPGVLSTGLATDVFGRTGRQLLPVLFLQEQAISEYLTTLDRFGARLSALDQKEYEEFKRAQFELQAALQGVYNHIARQWIPILTQFQSNIATSINIWRTLVQIFSGTEPVVRSLAERMRRWGDILENVDRLLQRVLTQAQRYRDFLDPVGAALRRVAEEEEKVAQARSASAEAAATARDQEEKRQQAIEDTIEALNDLRTKLIESLDDIDRDAARKWDSILVQRQREAIDRARREAFRLIDLEAAYNDQLDQIEAAFAKRWDDILVKRQRDALLRGIRLAQRYEDLLRATERSRQDAIRDAQEREAEFRQEAQRRVQEAERDAQRKREELEREHLRRLRDIRQDFLDTATEAARRNDAVAVARAQRQRARELRDEQQRFEDERSDLDNALRQRREDIQRDRAEREQEQRDELARALARIQENYARQRAELELQNQREREIRQIRYRWELEDIEAAREEQLQAAEDAYNDQLDALRLAQAREQLERDIQYGRQQEDFNNALQQRRDDALAAYEKERDDLAAHLSLTGQQLEAVYAEWAKEAAAAAAEVARAAADALASEITRYQHLLTEAERARARAIPVQGVAPATTPQKAPFSVGPYIPGAPVLSQAEGGVVQASSPTNVIMGDAGPETAVFLPGRSSSMNVNHNFGRLPVDFNGLPGGMNTQQVQNIVYQVMTQLAKGVQVPRR